MKLYTSRGAVSPARVQFFLAEKGIELEYVQVDLMKGCLLYTSPSPRDKRQSRMPSSA